MRINQVYSLLNDLNSQLFGEDAVQVKDLSGIISMGQSIVGDGTQTDLFLGKLVDRIGKTVIRTLDLELEFPTLFMNEFEFGAVLQKITVNPFEAIQSSEYKIGENGFTPTMLDIHKPDVICTYFTGADTAKFQVTIPDDLFSTAFTSESAMAQFVDAIINAMTDSMTIAINTMSRTAINNFIAEKIFAGNGVINLLSLYNETLVSPITASAAMVSKEFFRFAVNTIRKYIKYMSQPSVLYNVGDGSGNPVLRATARDNMHVLMLTDFVAGVASYLESDTFHDEMLGMPLYTEVAYWQGNHGASGDNIFAVNSKVDLIPSSQDGVAAGSKYEVAQNGVVAVLADRQAIGVGISKRRAGNFYNSIDGYSNISQTFLEQYYNDLSESGIIFIVADAEATPTITLDKSSLTFANSSAADQTVTATVVPEGATVTWKSSKSSVATVAAGVVSAAGTGSCTISAEITVGGVKRIATCAVTVG